MKIFKIKIKILNKIFPSKLDPKDGPNAVFLDGTTLKFWLTYFWLIIHQFFFCISL